MRVGLGRLGHILRKFSGSKHGLRWLLLACTLLYGLLDYHPELLPGFETLLSNGQCKHVGMPVTVRDSVYARLLIPLTPLQLSSAGQLPQRLICLAPTKSAEPISLSLLESAQGLHLAPRTLDTITCWEARDD